MSRDEPHRRDDHIDPAPSLSRARGRDDDVKHTPPEAAFVPVNW
jgi:hypothetical protein